MLHKKQLILRNRLNKEEIELARKTCRALNLLINTRKKSIYTENNLFNSINSELSNICINNMENAHLLNTVIIFDENKQKFKLNWK